MDEEDFVTYEQALTLKKLGFRERCLYYYNENKIIVFEIGSYPNSINQLFISPYKGDICDAPTLAQAQKWLRINKQLFVTTSGGMFDQGDESPWYYYSVLDVNDGHEEHPDLNDDLNRYYSPEKALSAGITKVLNYLENK